MLKRLFRPRSDPAHRPAAIPTGERVYAVGDIHGRDDLLERLLDTIAHDDAARAPARTTLIFLGDLIDRGPDSARVIERLRHLAARRPDTRFLLGNHEEILVASAAMLSARAVALRCVRARNRPPSIFAALSRQNRAAKRGSYPAL